MSDTVHLQGKIEKGSLPDLVQYLSAQTELVGYLGIVGGNAPGRIWFSGGKILAVQLGALYDEQALCDMLRIEHGSFAFVPSRDVPPPRITKDPLAMLLDCVRAIDEEEALRLEERAAATPDSFPRSTKPASMLPESVQPPVPRMRRTRRKREAGDKSPEEGPPPATPETPVPTMTPATPTAPVAPALAAAHHPMAPVEKRPAEPPLSTPGERPPGLSMRPRPETPQVIATQPKATTKEVVAAPPAPRARPRTALLVLLLSTVIVTEGLVLVWALRPSRHGAIEAEISSKVAAAREEERRFRERIEEILARGDAAWRAGETDKAIACYTDARTLAPDDQRIERLLSILRSAAADRSAARTAALGDAERREQNEEVRRRLSDLLHRADLAERAGNTEEALRHMQAASALDRDNPVLERLHRQVEARHQTALSSETQREEERRRASERSARFAELVRNGDAKRRAGALEDAMDDYMDALVLLPVDETARRRILDLTQEIETRGLAGFGPAWSLEVEVGSMTVESLALDGGQTIDIVVTAHGGVIRVGRIDPFGKPLVLLWENPHPRTQGEAKFTLEGVAYGIRWRPVELSSSRNRYRIHVRRV